MAKALPEKVAHRGASVERLENTLEAFALALDRGADAIELDVHRTRDSVVVVHHDDAVRGVEIGGADWADVARWSLKGGERIPRLEDVLELVGDRAAVYVELKGAGVTTPAIEVCRRVGKRYAMHSFDHAMIEQVQREAPETPRGVLLDKGIRKPLDAMRAAVSRTKARDVWPHFSLVDEEFMSGANELRARVVVWTVNDAAEAQRLARLGVAGLCGDDVRLFG